MDIQLEKYKLMKWLINLEDEAIISKLNNFKNELTATSNWTNEISETEKLMVEAGLKDVEDGNTFTHEEVMKQINDAYGLK
ncbi:hypothetical protein [Neptunitalea lumnitzerae]|uniref:Uncharacterized protein n=1 Tax=Neptunitalea lumnitzerae TaxID=2965509 RepID=A0ABQ5MG99_9FLAO|nr:hypothetical protein [Neptunitalea sp. Y10]GLB48414.1 hypothetical protein Y10_07820 [Neptunitalea sp. Y10]